jgi:hypothetical protein
MSLTAQTRKCCHQRLLLKVVDVHQGETILTKLAGPKPELENIVYSDTR